MHHERYRLDLFRCGTRALGYALHWTGGYVEYLGQRLGKRMEYAGWRLFVR